MNTPWPALLVEAPWLVMLLAKVTVLLAAGWVADVALSRANPRWRVLLWRGAALVLVALPLLMLALPAVRVEVAALPALPAAQVPAEAAPVAAVQVVCAAWGYGQARPWLGAGLWAAGLALTAVRTAIGHRRIGRLLDASRPVPEAAARAFSAIAVGIGCRKAAAFRAVPGLGSPLLVGLRRPVVLLPESILHGAERHDLEGIVAHELAHVRSNDLAWAYALHWLSAALWFHPLAWGMGRAHAQACELVSDAISAGYVGSGRTYARTLTRVAVGMRALQPAPAGLPLAGRSEIGGRIAALRRGIAAHRLPVVWAVVACVAAAGITAALSALIFTQVSPAGTVMTEYGPVSASVARALEQKVTLAPPYPASHEGARRDMISVQYAVIVLSDQVGLAFRWGDSYPGAYPASAALVRPDIRDVPWREAMQEVVEPVGLRFSIRDGEVVLRSADEADSAQPAVGEGRRASLYP